jgi:pilus assembly protein Flp/PilA
MKDMLRKLKEERGATAVEYGMMVALIAAVIVISVTALGTTVDGVFTDIVTALTPA